MAELVYPPVIGFVRTVFKAQGCGWTSAAPRMCRARVARCW